MPRTALVLSVLFLVLAIAWRSLVQYRRTGDLGFRQPSRRAGPLEKTAGLLVLTGAVGLLSSPVLALSGLTDPLAPLDSVAIRAVGLLSACAGIALTVLAEFQMGDSWRVGVDPSETTALVEHGLYARIRNPIYSGMVLFAFGLTALAPSLLSVIASLVFVLGIQLQVRGVEEPYLSERHRQSYTAYAKRAGRFLPRVGRIA
jgi:protein-S-isoprenylcysteine O-methyltransferase Ste14